MTISIFYYYMQLSGPSLIYNAVCMLFVKSTISVERFFVGEELHIVSNIQYVHIYPIYIIKYKRDIQYIQYTYIYINIIKGTSENIMVSK